LTFVVAQFIGQQILLDHPTIGGVYDLYLISTKK